MLLASTLKYRNLKTASWQECVKVSQSYPSLCDPMDYTVHGILQARILEWVAFPFSRGSSQPRDQSLDSHTVDRFFTSWATREVQEYWSRQRIPSPVDLPDPGIELASAVQVDSLPPELSGKGFSLLFWSGNNTSIQRIVVLAFFFLLEFINHKDFFFKNSHTILNCFNHPRGCSKTLQIFGNHLVAWLESKAASVITQYYKISLD